MQSTTAVDGDFLRNVTRMAKGLKRLWQINQENCRACEWHQVLISWPEPAGEVVEGK